MKVTLLALDESCAVDFGLRIISSLLKKNGHNVYMLFNIIYTPAVSFKTTTFDPSRDNFNSIDNVAIRVADFIEENHSDLFGISVSTNHFERAARITEKVKQCKPELFIVWGGVHPTVCPDECLRYADCVCVGEGEKSILELVNRMTRGGDIYNISNLWFKDKNSTIRNKVNFLVEEIDELPFQDYDLTSHYLIETCEELKPMNDALMAQIMPKFVTNFSPSYMTMATRGCPYSCAYCINNFTNQLYEEQPRSKIVRRRSVENIISELINIKRRFPFINSVFFGDDLFIFGRDSKKWLADFSRQYKEKVSLPFMCLMHFNQVSDKTMELLVDAGLVQLSIGIESGSEKTSRDLYQRNLSPKVILEKAKIVNRYKQYVMPSYDTILDNPYESDSDIRQTLELISKLPEPFHLGLYSLTFFPGTPLYQRAKSDGLLRDELNQVYRKHYNDIDSRKYLNQLFLLYHYMPKSFVTYLLRRHDIVHKLLLSFLYHVWNSRHLFIRNQSLKRFLKTRFLQWLSGVKKEEPSSR